MKTKATLKKKSITRILSFSFFALLVSQCTVMSFYPLYTKDELVKDDRIVGTWMSKLTTEEVSEDSLVWNINPYKNNKVSTSKDNPKDKTYWLKIYPYENPKDVVEFEIHIVDLEGKLYLDFLIEEIPYENVFASIHLMPVHTFAQLEVKDKELTVKWFNNELLEKLLKENKIRIRHEKRKDGAQLLTAKPKELQKFVIKYSNRKDVYNENLSWNLTPWSKES